jgi:hypothetical protein
MTSTQLPYRTVLRLAARRPSPEAYLAPAGAAYSPPAGVRACRPLIGAGLVGLHQLMQPRNQGGDTTGKRNN